MNWHLKQVDKVIKFNQKAWLKWKEKKLFGV